MLENYSRWLLRGDVSVGYAQMLAEITGHFPAAVSAYWQRLQERLAYQRALEWQKSAALKAGIESWR